MYIDINNSFPKYRSSFSDEVLSRRETRDLYSNFSPAAIAKMVTSGLLIECGEWPKITEDFTWKDICDAGLIVEAVSKYRKVNRSTLSEAKKAVDNYRNSMDKD